MLIRPHCSLFVCLFKVMKHALRPNNTHLDAACLLVWEIHDAF